ncbi:phosphate uptake regulator, PhoU [Methanococcus maripaludis C5]|uniref:Phosphate-specific transport system accessory protein PhoU n=1 Tax=Methanococcus maripaludis (strain C5 / ATCC BAA-1333) TaxID=402880 RepID=A4FX70_METM5|nr:phosphate signaling complex protein PhoU [Methanococcus maripaludis]ABO34799.1 phosphate uptake regulator, PhoU [Methanococcus maripaludis C5]
MARTAFSNQMKEVEDMIYEMSEMCAIALENSITAFINNDIELAKVIKAGDDAIDLKEMEIEEKCISFMATQQPVASDLREMITMIKIISKLEKVGDMASRIAKITIKSEHDTLRSKNGSMLTIMGEILDKMLKNSISSFRNRDLTVAKETYLEDGKIDELYKVLCRDMTINMIENPKVISEAGDFIVVGTYLERVGNLCGSIGDRVAFMITGERLKEEEFEKILKKTTKKLEN